MSRSGSLLSIVSLALLASGAWASPNAVVITQKAAENQIKNLLNPILDKYCHDDCKLMSVLVAVDVATPDQVAPGFDEIESKSNQDLAPSAATIKLLMNDKVGPKTKSKLLELLQQYLDTMDYPVKVDTQTAHFPMPTGSEGKVAQLRERVTKQFRSTLDELVQQFCPQTCLVADYAMQTDVVNGEEAQYGDTGEFYQDGDTAIRVKDIAATLLVDEALSPEERKNILEMAKLKTNHFKNVSLSAKSMKFPRPGQIGVDGDGTGSGLAGTGNGRGTRNIASRDEKAEKAEKTEKTEKNETKSLTQQENTNNVTNNSNKSNESNTRQERFERVEKIERVESGDAVQAELQKFKVYGLVFACAVLSLLIFIALAAFRPKGGTMGGVTKIIQSLASDPVSEEAPVARESSGGDRSDRLGSLSRRYEIESLHDELMTVFAQHPRVAKQVFSRVLTEEGVETTSQYVHLFGETVVMDMLRDPSLQTDMGELMEFYAKNPIELSDDEKLDLLRKLHNRTVAGKLQVMGSRSSSLFDFLAEMDGTQILELIRTESLTVKSIILTQCDTQKRAQIYTQLDQDVRLNLLSELSRIDYLPRDYIFNVANALKRKRRENPRLNTEALPGSEVLVSLLERTGQSIQRSVVKSLEQTNPDSARVVKSKLVSIDTLRYLRDGQMLEVILSLKHDELLQFLKGTSQEIRNVVFSKAPKELVTELDEELTTVSLLSREGYNAVERKVLNRMKVMANEGLLNLVETNERMFAEGGPGDANIMDAATATNIKKVAGW